MGAADDPRDRRWLVFFARYRRYILAAGILVASLLYFPLNHAFADQRVLTTSLDSELPIVPIFAIPYLAFLPIFWITVLYAFFTDRNFSQLALAIIIAYMASNLVYLVFHTYMPRPDHVSGLFSGLVTYVYSHDHPYNDFPSEHASSATMLALYASQAPPRWRIGALVFAVLVVMATVLIRQHSLAGALGGVAVGVCAWLLAGRLARLPLFRPQPGV